MVEEICERQLATLERNAALFDRRVTEGRVVEGHGDLRPEHVCLEPKPQIIDCLEFSRRLRRLDPLDELGYLALECERLGASAIGAAILEAYRALSGDPAPARLQHAYQAYRALVRAMLAVRHLDDSAVADRAKWIARARGYVELACDHARKFDGGQLPSSASELPE
jgi:aminoglycoside phosphotransferase family enzyme